MSDGEIFVVEAIRKHVYRNNKLLYYVKWQGYPESDNTWEPEENLFCEELLNKYKTKAGLQYIQSPKIKTKTSGFNKKIAEILGITEGSTNFDMSFYVRLQGEMKCVELPLETIAEANPDMLIDFFESYIP